MPWEKRGGRAGILFTCLWKCIREAGEGEKKGNLPTFHVISKERCLRQYFPLGGFVRAAVQEPTHPTSSIYKLALLLCAVSSWYSRTLCFFSLLARRPRVSAITGALVKRLPREFCQNISADWSLSVKWLTFYSPIRWNWWPSAGEYFSE